jgi:single-strand DNA-binding protein
MPNFNKVMVMGNLTKDPEIRYTSGGSAVCNLRLAINRAYVLQSGEKKEDVTFMTVIVWRKQAEACAEYLKKGDPLFAEGRLQSRTWETDDKQKRSVIEVVAERIQFLKSKKNETATEETTTTDAPPNEEDVPF